MIVLGLLITGVRGEGGESVEDSNDQKAGDWIRTIVGALGWVPLPAAFLSAAVAVVLLRCITIEKA